MSKCKVDVSINKTPKPSLSEEVYAALEQNIDNRMVSDCHNAMADKMRKGRAVGKHRWWDTEACAPSTLQHFLLTALVDGDLVSVMNYAGMLHVRGDSGPVVWPWTAEQVESLKKELADAKAKIITQQDTIRLQKMTIDQQNATLSKKVTGPDITLQIEQGGVPVDMCNERLKALAADTSKITGAIKGTAQLLGVSNEGVFAEATMASIERDRAYVTITKAVGEIAETITVEFDFAHTDTSASDASDAIAATVHAVQNDPDMVSIELEPLRLDLMEHPECC